MALQQVVKGYGGAAKFTVAASAARTAELTTDDFTVPYGQTLHLTIEVTSITSTPILTPSIEGVTGPLGNVYTVLLGAAISATGITVLKIGPGIGQVANGAAADMLPDVWRVVVAVADTDSATYSIEAEVR